MDSTAPLPTLADADEMMKTFKISLRTLGAWRARRLIPYVRIGRVIRYDRVAVAAAVAKLTVQVCA